jgi:hypothetical protein
LKYLQWSKHLLNLWLESHNLFHDHPLPHYTHWKSRGSLSTFNGVTCNENISNKSSLWNLRMTHCFINQIGVNFTYLNNLSNLTRTLISFFTTILDRISKTSNSSNCHSILCCFLKQHRPTTILEGIIWILIVPIIMTKKTLIKPQVVYHNNFKTFVMWVLETLQQKSNNSFLLIWRFQTSTLFKDLLWIWSSWVCNIKFRVWY